MPAAARRFDPDAEVTEIVPALQLVPAPGLGDRRGGERRGTGIPVIWFHGERRLKARRGGERRNEKRAPVCLELEELSGRYTFWRYTADLSEGGLSVRHAIPHPKGSLVLLRFSLPDDREDELVRVWARVVGVRDGGEGMRYRFVGLSRADRARIEAYLDAYPPALALA